MCRVTLNNPLLCPCKDKACRQVRPSEESLLRRNCIPGRSHVVGAEERFLGASLPCDAFWASEDSWTVVSTGGGDAAMWNAVVLFCPDIKITAMGDAKYAGRLCVKCQTKCNQGDATNLQQKKN